MRNYPDCRSARANPAAKAVPRWSCCGGHSTLDTAQGLQQWLAERRTPPEVNIDPEHDLAALPYSSGTTGLPKGVKLTHRQLVSNLQQAEDIGLVKKDDVAFGVLPFFTSMD